MMSHIISAYATPCTIVVQSTPDHKLLVSGTLGSQTKGNGGGGGVGGITAKYVPILIIDKQTNSIV